VFLPVFDDGTPHQPDDFSGFEAVCASLSSEKTVPADEVNREL
jgi:hypothetical protein